MFFGLPELWLIFLLPGNCSGLFNVHVRSIHIDFSRKKKAQKDTHLKIKAGFFKDLNGRGVCSWLLEWLIEF